MASPSPKRSPRSGSSTPVSSDTRATAYVPRCTTDQYIRAIAHHSQQSSADTLYPGEIYRSLKRFLEQDSNQLADSYTFSDFAYLVSPHPTGQRASLDSRSPSDDHLMLDNSRNRGHSEGFADPESCIRALRRNIEMSHPQVLFLRGHPSPSWLAAIGAFCHVDPELFRWFLRYREEPGSDYYFGHSPSTMSNMFRFRFFTIGSKTGRYRSSQAEVDALRLKAANDLRRYQTDLRGNWALKPGDSIMRNFRLLDERHCVIEQEIVIHIFDIGKTWMAIACTDAGRDLTQGPGLPWLGADTDSSPTTLLPIVQYRQRCALKSRSISENTDEPKKGKSTQSLGIFPEGYGQGLDWSLAESDRTCILSDVFRLAAFSQKQLLNVMEEKVHGETDRLSSSGEIQTLANLLYFRDVLQDQLSNTSYMMQLINGRTKSPRTGRRSITTISSEHKTVPNHTMAEIYSLFQELHSQAQSLHEKCTQGMTVISNNSMLAESQRAMQQAKLVTKLTLVAFVYLPFTFTAGFFGMNFKELGNGTMSLWIFFAASVPLMIVTMAFFALDARTAKRLLLGLHIFDHDRRKVS